MDLFLNIKTACVGLIEYFGVKMYGSLMLTVASYMIGAQNFELVYALMFLAIIDFITGVASAKVSGDIISSPKMFRGATKFIVYILFISAAHLSETIIPGSTYFENIIISFLALTEFISIIENIGKMGFAVPQQLLNKLQKYRDEQ